MEQTLTTCDLQPSLLVRPKWTLQ